jgi:hypothetical protein
MTSAQPASALTVTQRVLHPCLELPTNGETRHRRQFRDDVFAHMNFSSTLLQEQGG